MYNDVKTFEIIRKNHRDTMFQSMVASPSPPISWIQDICVAPYRENAPLKRSEWHLLTSDHSFTCRPHVYPRTE